MADQLHVCALARRKRVRMGRPLRSAGAEGPRALTTPLALRPHPPPFCSQTRAMSSKLVVVFMFLALMRALAQTVITLAGGNSSGTTSGSTNGVGTAALFNGPCGVAVHQERVYAVDGGNHRIRIIYYNQSVVSLVGGGSTGNLSGSADGVGTNALFNSPFGLAVDAAGTVFVADSLNHKLRRVHPNRTVITIAGGGSTGNVSGSSNGLGTAALMNQPRGIAINTTGTLYVAERGNRRILLVYPNLTVITLAGGGASGVIAGNTNGVGTAALFNVPSGVAVDTSGKVYVADSANCKIRLIYPNRTVVTLVGSGCGFADGVGTAALFGLSYGIALAATGNLYVADRDNSKIRLVFPNLTVVSLAGGGTTGNKSGDTDGAGDVALFKMSAMGVAVDTSNFVFVGDSGNHKVRLIYPFSCSPGSFFNTSLRGCSWCLPGFFSNMRSAFFCSTCSAGTFAKPFGSTSCEACPAGHACPPGTSSWARLNCGLGNYCPEGSAEPIPCPIQIVPVPYASWASHPLTAQGPAFLMDTSVCLNHCFWNFTSGDGMLSKC